MTRLLYLPDDVTIIQFEVKIPARQLTAAINAGLRPVPQLANGTDKLIASQLGNTVIVSPHRKLGRPSQNKSRSNLTHRQSQVLDLAVHGYTNNQIAEIVGISRRTVAYHLKGIKSQIKNDPLPIILQEQKD